MTLAAIRDELREYFFQPPLAAGVSAQTYDPRGSGTYDPYADARLARLVFARDPERARVRRVLDELSDVQVGVLRLACSAHDTSPVAARLPSALAQGRVIAQRLADELAAENEYRFRRDYLGETGILLAVHVLERRCTRPVSDVEVESATAAAARAGELADEVYAEATSLIDGAAAAYIAARDRLKQTKAAAKERRAAERQALADELLGKKRRKEAARFEARLRRAS